MLPHFYKSRIYEERNSTTRHCLQTGTRCVCVCLCEIPRFKGQYAEDQKHGFGTFTWQAWPHGYGLFWCAVSVAPSDFDSSSVRSRCCFSAVAFSDVAWKLLFSLPSIALRDGHRKIETVNPVCPSSRCRQAQGVMAFA